MNPNTRKNRKSSPLIDILWPDGRILSAPREWRDIVGMTTAELRSLAEDGGVSVRNDQGHYLSRDALLSAVKTARTSESRRLGHVSRLVGKYMEATGCDGMTALSHFQGELPEAMREKLSAARDAALESDTESDSDSE